jgi:stage II sporulation protein E
MVVLAQVTVYGYFPVGIAFFAAMQMTTGSGMLAWISATLGMCSSASFITAVKGSMICMLVWMIVEMIKKATGKKENKYITAAVAGTVTMAMELVDVVLGQNTGWLVTKAPAWVTWLIPLFLGILTSCLAIIFRLAVAVVWAEEKRKIFGNEEAVSVAFILGLVLYRLGGFDVGQFSPMEAVLTFVLAVFAYKYGTTIGALVGCGCGLVVTVLTGSISFLGIFSLMGILAGSFRQLGRLGTMAGMALTVAMMGMLYEPALFTRVWVQGYLIGIGAFLLLPPVLLKRISVEAEPVYLEAASTEVTAMRLGNAANSFLKLSQSFSQFPAKQSALSYEAIGNMVDSVSEKYCRNCIRWDTCWNKGKYEAYRETTELFRKAGENGTVFLTDVPKSFSARCRNIHGLVAEVNHLMEQSRMNLLWQNRLVDSKMAVAAQLREVSGILSDFSKEEGQVSYLSKEQEEEIRLQLKGKRVLLNRIQIFETRNGRMEINLFARAMRHASVPVREVEQILEQVLERPLRLSNQNIIMIGAEVVHIHFLEDVNYKILFGSAKCAKKGDTISGDNFGFTQLNCGQTIMTISDGMGHGKQAYTESETVIELLEQMLETGFREEVSLKLINLSLMVNEEAGNTATVDLGIVDQYTGICDFIKMGAAPAYIKHRDWVEMLKSTSLPMGILDGVDYDRVTKKLEDGDMIIMVSDGVVEAMEGQYKEVALCELIGQITEPNPREFARTLMERLENGQEGDDMTILAGSVVSSAF